MKVAGGCRLPTVFELTGDSRWDVGGEYWGLYDLGIDGSERNEDNSTVLPEMETEDSIEEKSVLLDADGAVKMFSGKRHLIIIFKRTIWFRNWFQQESTIWRMNSAACCR